MTIKQILTSVAIALCLCSGVAAQGEASIRSSSSSNNTAIVILPNQEGRFTINWARGARRSTYVTLRINGVTIHRSVDQILRGDSGPVRLGSGVITQSSGRKSVRLRLPPNAAPRGSFGTLTIQGPNTFDVDPIFVF